MTARAGRGFSLLEAIVALAVFSTAALALYGWLSTNVVGLGRAEARIDALRDARAGLAVVETINPMAEPRGSRDLDGLIVEWTSEEVVPRRSGTTATGLPSVFDLALYELEVTVRRGPRETYRFQVRRAGWESVRSSGLFDE